MDARSREDCVALTGSCAEGSIVTGQDEEQDGRAYARRMLSPLVSGLPVVLVVEDEKLPKRKRAAAPRLFITPMSVYGPPSRKLVVALETHGCEVIDTSEPIRPMSFIRLGIRPVYAKALANELSEVLSVRRKHGKA